LQVLLLGVAVRRRRSGPRAGKFPFENIDENVDRVGILIARPDVGMQTRAQGVGYNGAKLGGAGR